MGDSVLFVCTANMCRSPMAEYLLREELPKESAWTVRSAGTDAADGMPATDQAVSAMEEIGVDMGRHRSRRLTRETADEADVIVVMTAAHAERIEWRFPDVAHKVCRLKSFVPNAASEDTDIPDPIGLGEYIYRAIRDEMQVAMPQLCRYLESIEKEKRGQP